MNVIDINLFHEESFVEESIKSSSVNYQDKIIVIETDGAYLTTEEYLSKAQIIIKNWYKLDVIERRGEESKILSSYPEFLDTIIEFHYSENQLMLRDIGNSCWEDWVFLRPQVTIYGEFDEE